MLTYKAIDFKKTLIGQSDIVTFVIKNIGTEQVRLDSWWMEKNPTPFQYIGGTCYFDNSKGFIVKPNEEVTLEIKYSPKDLAVSLNVFVVGHFLGFSWEWKELKIVLSAQSLPLETPNIPTSTTPTEKKSFLKVVGNKIVNDRGEQVVLKGLNIADVEHLNTKPWERANVDAKKVALLATDTYKAKVVRIPVLPGSSSYPNEGFLSLTNGFDKYFNNHLKPIVDLITSKGVYAIIDFHYVSDYSHLYGNCKKFWEYIAPKFKDNPFVIYEIFNEPIEPDNWDIWKVLISQPLVNLIRSLAPDNLILVGGPYWSSHMEGAARSPILGNNLVYVAHIYSNQSRISWNTHYGPLLSKYPLFVTEWGFEKGGTEGGDIKYGKELVAWMDDNNISWTVWSLDTLWGPCMVNTDWSLKSGPGGMGEFVRDLLS